MLKSFSRLQITAALVAVGFGIYYLSIPIIGPFYAEVCSKGENGHPDQCAYWDAATAAILNACNWANDNSGLITAISGVAVAFFTFTLWRSTDKLWSATNTAVADAKTSGIEQAGRVERSIAEAGRAASATEALATATHDANVIMRKATESSIYEAARAASAMENLANETEAANYTSRKHTEALIAEAAEANRIANEVSRAQLKPFVHPIEMTLHLIGDIAPKVSVKFFNCGSTPALNVEFFVYIDFEPWLDATSYEKPVRNHSVNFGAIPPNQTPTRQLTLVNMAKANQKSREITSDDGFPAVYTLRGFIRYRDHFKTIYITDFAYIHEGDFDSVNPTVFKPVYMRCPTYQEVDEHDQPIEGGAHTSPPS